MAASYDQHGLWDAEKYLELVKGIDILTYDPPQKKVSFTGIWRNWNLWTPRSPWGVGFPCCLGESLRCYLNTKGHEVQDVFISKPDEWFLKLMEPPPEGNHCPEILRGVFWMQDNIANETIVSLESAHWGKPDGPHPNLGIKHCFRNWTTGTGMLGTTVLVVKERLWPVFQVAVDKKWISLSKDDYIYVLDANDKLVDPQGNEIPFRVGDDLLRITWVEGKPEKGIYYQYLLRRIAFKDADGKLQKTPTYEKLLDRATRPTVQGTCCNFFLCNISDDQYSSIYDSIDDHQLLVPGPEVDLPWHPDSGKHRRDIPTEESVNSIWM